MIKPAPLTAAGRFRMRFVARMQALTANRQFFNAIPLHFISTARDLRNRDFPFTRNFHSGLDNIFFPVTRGRGNISWQIKFCSEESAILCERPMPVSSIPPHHAGMPRSAVTL